MPPFTVIDASTDGVYGPFETERQARECAEQFHFYEILNQDGALIDWRGKLPRPPAQQEA